MSFIATALANSSFGKWLFGLVFGVQTLAIVQDTQVNQTNFLDSLLNNVPAQITYVLGIIYGVAIVLSKVSNLWKQHQLNRLEVKKEIEHLEQEEIDTEIKRKEIDK